MAVMRPPSPQKLRSRTATKPRDAGAASVPVKPGRRELQRQETERLIKDTALRLFSADGFDATTTKQIADAAGVAHGTVFLVAATKEALLVKVLEQRLREVVATQAQSMPGRRIVAQLVHLFDALFDFYASETRLSRVFLKGTMFFAEPIAKATYDEHVARFSRYLATLLDAAKARGEISPGARSEAVAGNLMALYVFEVVAFLNADIPDRAALGARFRAGLDQMLVGFGPPASSARSARPRGKAKPR